MAVDQSFNLILILYFNLEMWILFHIPRGASDYACPKVWEQSLQVKGPKGSNWALIKCRHGHNLLNITLGNPTLSTGTNEVTC